MGKGEEQVLVFPHCGLPKLGEFPGLVTTEESLRALMKDILPNSRFMFRKDVEDDPTMQQIIPYVVCCDEGKVLVYNRGGKGGEGRLADSWSIGIGGHINPVDAESGPLPQALTWAILRELEEELGTPSVPDLKYEGILKTETAEVDLVHTGVVFTATFNNVSDFYGSEEIERHKWVTLEELTDYKLESWSEVVRDHLNKTETHNE